MRAATIDPLPARRPVLARSPRLFIKSVADAQLQNRMDFAVVDIVLATGTFRLKISGADTVVEAVNDGSRTRP
jgi:hypothetical protein